MAEQAPPSPIHVRVISENAAYLPVDVTCLKPSKDTRRENA